MQFPCPGAADKERSEAPARSPVTPAGEEPGAGGGSRGTYKSRVPPEEPGRVFGAAAGDGAGRGAAAATTTTSSR